MYNYTMNLILFIIYLLITFSLLIFLIFISIYILFLIYSSIKGSPYVPTKKRVLDKIFSQIPIKKNKLFIELGSGDGRILRYVVKKYQVKGLGVDVNPILVILSKFYAWIENSGEEINFQRKSVFDIDLSQSDYIYIFLMPELIKKLTKKMNKELKNGTIIISHGFKIEDWENKLIKVLKNKPFNTYYYRF